MLPTSQELGDGGVGRRGERRSLLAVELGPLGLVAGRQKRLTSVRGHLRGWYI
jgi:hypothetical protein